MRTVAWLVAVGLILTGGRARAAELQEAQVTVVIKDVQLLPSQAAARAAALNEKVRQGTAVRTGADSRTELTFTDQTIARMGQNTLFSFDAGTRNINLGSGVMLVHVPKGGGGAKITTAGVTAGVTGTTLMVEYHKRAPAKLIVLEGAVRMWLTLNPAELKVVHAGQMLVVPPNATKLPEPETVDLEKLMNSALLVTEFPPLPSLALIAAEIAQQQAGGPWQIDIDPTNIDDISQAIAAFPPPGVPPRPPGFGTTITYGGADPGNWSNPASWIPPVVPNNRPTKLYTAIMNSGTLFQDIAAGVIIQQLQMNGGMIVLSNQLRLNTGLLYTGGAFSGGNLFTAGTSTQSVLMTVQNVKLTNSGTYDITFDSSNAFAGGGSTFINTGTLRKTTGADVITFNLALNNSGTVSVLSGALSFSGGGTNSGIFSAAGGAVINFASDFSMLDGTTFTGPGATSFNNGTHTTLSGTITNNRSIFVNSAGTLTDFILNGDVTLTGGGTIFLTNADRILGNGVLTNVNNAIRGDTAGGGSIGADQIGIINGTLGVIDANTGLLDVDPNASGLVNHGVMQASNGGTLRLSGNGAGGFSSDGTIQATSGGALQFNGAVTNTGLVDVGNNSLTVGGSYMQTAGTFHMVGGSVVSATILDFQGGMVDAHGGITGSINSGATLLPALGGSGLSVTGNVTLLNTSHLSFQLGGLTQGTQYSFLNVNGSVALSGQLVLSFANGFQNSVTGADTFTIANAGALSGAFSNVASDARLTTSDGFGSFIVSYGGNSIVLSGFIPTVVSFSGTWVGTTGNWSDATKWDINPRFPNNGQPNPGDVYDATLSNGGSITLDIPITIEHFNLTSGVVTGANSLTMNQLFTWNGGRLLSGVVANANAGILFNGGSVSLDGSTLNNAAGQTAAMLGASVLSMNNNAVFNNNGIFLAQNNGSISNAGGVVVTFNNNGTFARDTSAGTFTIDAGFNNPGTLNVNIGNLALNGPTNSSGPINVNSNATLSLGGTFTQTGDAINLFSGSLSVSGAAGAHMISGTDGTVTVTGSGTLSVASGLNFNGANGTAVLQPTDGGSLTWTAPSVTFDATGINGATFNGGDADPATNNRGGNGGTLDVTATTGDITVNTPINATTGANGTAPPPTGGTGGTVNLTASQGTVNINNRILVSDRTAGRQSAASGHINITSHAPTGVAINISSTGQLLALLDAAAPGPGGKIIILADGASSQVNVGGAIAADHNINDPSLIDIRQTGGAGQITLTNANLSADIIKVAALGDNGRLTIGGGNISANTILRLYAGGTTGQIFFIADCNISSGTELSIAANTVHIDNGVMVNVTGPQAQVYTNNAQYVGGNQPTTGQFIGSGANTNLGVPPPPLRPGRNR
jgi:mannose-6-phosphate isomerase-like protein (cupin superfamily)